MVVSGGFALQLVDANSGAPYKELLDTSGQSWVAGEQGDEYFLQAKHVISPGCRTMCFLEVDGVRIGKYKKDAGSLGWSRNLGLKKSGQTIARGEEGVCHALKFQRIGQAAAQAADDDGADEGRPPAHGMITATFYRSTKLGKKHHSTTTGGTNLGSSTQSHADNKKEGAAALKSTAGSAPASYKPSSHKSITHEELGRVTIRYTSDFGLAVRGLHKHGDGEQQHSAAAASSALLPRAKRPKRDEAAHRPVASSSSSAAVVTVVDDEEDEQKPAVGSRATGFAKGEVVDLLDSD